MLISRTLYKFFKKSGIDNGWLFSLTYGINTLYNNDTELLSIYFDEEGLNINAISLGDKKFSIELLREILGLVKAHEKVVVPTTINLSENIRKRYDLIQIGHIYYKGGLDGVYNKPVRDR